VDDQAGQLRFNFINSNHAKLPFGSPVIIVQTEDEILLDYLTGQEPESGITKVFQELMEV
jgi:hypothetical protein